LVLVMGALAEWLVLRNVKLRRKLRVAVERCINAAVLSAATAQRRGRNA
jgi:hypothetical protein